jgi:hypothetical protein
VAICLRERRIDGTRSQRDEAGAWLGHRSGRLNPAGWGGSREGEELKRSRNPFKTCGWSRGCRSNECKNVLFVSTSMENHGTMRTELGSEMEVGLVQVGNLGPLVLARRGKSAARQSRQRTAKSANGRSTGEAGTQRWVIPVYPVLTCISLSSLRDGDCTGAQRIIFCTSADAAALVIPQTSSSRP